MQYKPCFYQEFENERRLAQYEGINEKKRRFATYVAFGIVVIGKSVSDISQISSLWSEGLRQISSKFKRKISNSLILDKKIKFETD